MTIRQTRLWIGGEFCSAKDKATFIDLNPEDDMPYAEVSRASGDDVKLAVEAANEAFQSYRDTTPSQREAWLSRAADLFGQRMNELVDVLVDEGGSPLMKAQYEVKFAIDCLRTAVGIPRRTTGMTFPSDNPGRFSMAVRAPIGVFACITPFNVPLIKAMVECTGPLATGNTVVMLASEEAPVIAIRIAEIFRDAGFPPGSFNVLTGFGHEIGDTLVTHPLVKGVNFTGSTRVGRHLSELCGRHMKRILLELGGKNPLIVLKDADLNEAVQGAVFGMFLYQGQACMASSRILVEASIYDAFLESFKAASSSLGFGDLREPRTMIGPIISNRQRERIRRHIDDAVAKGAKVEMGGSWEGNRCAATILTGVQREMDCYYEETFGPVTAVYKVDSADEALTIANDTSYGLSAAVYTKNLSEAMRLSQSIRAGMVHINAPTLHDEPHVPFGGVGDSGMGREGAVTDIDHCTEWKWVTVQAPNVISGQH
ncbi:aldehyde dehydrogenase [Burkholderia sp. K24]|jgi:acyl-CoA reductase-like NAD-dependent aldehyde dehydrogenase|nr:aldehyde dehydrogenase [Burkholderia sp. K24]